MEYGWLCLLPALVAVLLCFITREPIFSLATACLAGVLIMGKGIVGFPELLIDALGTRDYIWIVMAQLCIGILVALYQRCGAVRMFSLKVAGITKTRSQTQFLTWCLGLFIFFSDYFSSLFVGPVMRDLTDKAKISREKLAFICDSTAAPIVVLAPFSAWAVYIMSLLIGIGPIDDRTAAISLFLKAIPFNFYSIFSILLVLFIALKIVPDYGPMRRAEKRAIETGEVLRKGSTPMMSIELTNLPISDSGRPNLVINFIFPVLIVIIVNIWTFIALGRTEILYSFMLAGAYLATMMLFQKVDNLHGIMQTGLAGIKGVIPAAMILAFAFGIKSLNNEMGTAQFIMENCSEWFNPFLLPALTFFLSAFISFATGTSWGTFAIVIPIAIPLAFEFSQGQITSLVIFTLAASAGGGVFGDHCSPLSDTTVLSSLGSACDLMDHVRTQLPYALTAGAFTCILYLLLTAVM